MFSSALSSSMSCLKKNQVLSEGRALVAATEIILKRGWLRSCSGRNLVSEEGRHECIPDSVTPSLCSLGLICGRRSCARLRRPAANGISSRIMDEERLRQQSCRKSQQFAEGLGIPQPSQIAGRVKLQKRIAEENSESGPEASLEPNQSG